MYTVISDLEDVFIAIRLPEAYWYSWTHDMLKDYYKDSLIDEVDMIHLNLSHGNLSPYSEELLNILHVQPDTDYANYIATTIKDYGYDIHFVSDIYFGATNEFVIFQLTYT